MSKAKEKLIKLNCYVLEDDHDDYFSACLTLNLTASGKTLQEAKDNLKLEIVDYLHLVFNEFKFNTFKEYKPFLNRRAPWFMWKEYFICSFSTLIMKGLEYLKPRKKHKEKRETFSDKEFIPVFG